MNPSTSRELHLRLLPPSARRSILVAGGGVAGMEFARSAALRGHRVTIHEATDRLGGHMLEYGVPQFKAEIRRLHAWCVRELRDLEVPVELGSAVSDDMVEQLDPDVVVVATGSKYPRPDDAAARAPTSSRVPTCSFAARTRSRERYW